ncbi:MAG: hypothetical protein R3D58_13790 [Saprospiraceae bacterium]|nr:hypothetical protein [Lewinellaceae bacterium]
MKKFRVLILFSTCLFAFGLLAPACSQKSGCPANESLRAPVGKNGEIKKSKGSKSGLFPKKMTKRMK